MERAYDWPNRKRGTTGNVIRVTNATIRAVDAPAVRWAGRHANAAEPRIDTTPRLLRSVTVAFLALHRRTWLVLAAGRVTDPEPYREDEEDR